MNIYACFIYIIACQCMIFQQDCSMELCAIKNNQKTFVLDFVLDLFANF